MVWLTVWRHGEAGLAVTDQQRELTPDGREAVALGADRFLTHCRQRQLPEPDNILHSPYTRTTQTAEILQAGFRNIPCQPCSSLAPGGDIAGVESVLEKPGGSAESEHLVLVSHQPLVSYLADHWLGERGLIPSLSPGACVCLSLSFTASAGGTLAFAAYPPDYEVLL